MTHPLRRINGAKSALANDTDREPVTTLLPLVPINGLELETHFILLAMLEDAESADVEALHARLPGIDHAVASLIFDRLERTGWIRPDRDHEATDSPVRAGPEFYELTHEGTASAVDLLAPLKDRFFGTLAQRLNFKLNEIFPEEEADQDD